MFKIFPSVGIRFYPTDSNFSPTPSTFFDLPYYEQRQDCEDGFEKCYRQPVDLRGVVCVQALSPSAVTIKLYNSLGVQLGGDISPIVTGFQEGFDVYSAEIGLNALAPDDGSYFTIENLSGDYAKSEQLTGVNRRLLRITYQNLSNHCDYGNYESCWFNCVYIPGCLKPINFGWNVSEFRDSDGKIINLVYERDRVFELSVEHAPYYLHDILSLALTHDKVIIEQIQGSTTIAAEFQIIPGETYEIIEQDRYSLYPSTVRLIQTGSFIRRMRAAEGDSVNAVAPLILDETNVTATSFTANWSAVSGATSYDLQLSEDPTFDTTIVDTTTTNTFFNFAGLNNTTTYYYRVRVNSEGCVSAWSVETFEFPANLKLLSFHWRIGETDAPAVGQRLTYELTEKMSAAVAVDVLNSDKTRITFRYASNVPNLDLPPNPYASETSWSSDLTLLSGSGDFIALENDQSFTEIDVTIIVEYELPTPTPVGQVLNTRSSSLRVSADGAVAFNRNIQITGTVADCYVGLRTASPSVEDWTQFPYNIQLAGDLTALNTELSTNPIYSDGNDWILHFWSDDPGNNKVINFQFTDVNNVREFRDFVGENSNTDYRNILDGNGQRFDGITNRNRILNFNGADIATGQDLTFLVSVDNTLLSGSNVKMFFSTAADSSNNVLLSFGILNGRPSILLSQNSTGPNYFYIYPTTLLYRARRNIMIYQLEWLNVNAPVDMSLRMHIYYNGFHAFQDFNNIGYFDLANVTTNAGIMFYDSLNNPGNYFGASSVKKMELITKLASREQVRRAFNKGTFEGQFLNSAYVLNPDFSASAVGGSTGQLIPDNGFRNYQIEVYGGDTKQSFY